MNYSTAGLTAAQSAHENKGFFGNHTNWGKKAPCRTLKTLLG